MCMHISNPDDYCTVYKCMNIADPATIKMPVHRVNMVGNFKIDEHVISADLVNREIEIVNKPVKSIAICNLQKSTKEYVEDSRDIRDRKSQIKVPLRFSPFFLSPQPCFEPPPTPIV